LIAEVAAEYFGPLPISLDHPLDLLPEAGTRIDFRVFSDLARASSAWMRGAGARRGDIIAISKANRLDVLALACGAARMGAVPALLSPALEPSSLGLLLERLGGPVLFADSGVLHSAAAAGVDTGRLACRIVALDGQHPGAIPLSELRGAAIPQPALRQGRESVLVTHSSGTTGVAKLVLHAADGLIATAAAQMRMAKLLRIRGPVAACVSAFHARVVTGLMVLLGSGLPFASISDPNPAAARRILLEVKPEVLEAHPNILILWEWLASDVAQPLASVRVFNSTFDAAHPRTIKKLLAASRRRFPLYLQGLAQTEVGMVTLHPQTRGVRWHGARCVGWPWPGFNKVRIVDAHGDPLPAGHAGRIQVRSRGRCLTFVGQESQAAAREQDGWWDMGDRGFVTRWGCIHMLDRAEESIDGIASSLAVEDVLLERLPQLTEVIVIKLGEGPPATVYATADGKPLGAEDLARAAAGLPVLGESVHLAWNEFPRTGTWKVRRKDLRQKLVAVPA